MRLANIIFPLIRSSHQVGISSTLHQGILTMSGGPNYESVAELKMFSMLGVDCVGMSSIPECLTAHHCGNIVSPPVTAFSFILTVFCSIGKLSA